MKSQAMGMRRPIGLAQLNAMPGCYAVPFCVQGAEADGAKQGMVSPELNQALEKSEKVGIPSQQRPVEPTDLIVLAVSVVVSPLRAAHFIAAQHHRNAVGQKEDGGEVSDLPSA